MVPQQCDNAKYGGLIQLVPFWSPLSEHKWNRLSLARPGLASLGGISTLPDYGTARVFRSKCEAKFDRECSSQRSQRER